MQIDLSNKTALEFFHEKLMAVVAAVAVVNQRDRGRPRYVKSRILLDYKPELEHLALLLIDGDVQGLYRAIWGEVLMEQRDRQEIIFGSYIPGSSNEYCEGVVGL